MLKIEHLTKYYGTCKGVEDLSVHLKKGEIFGFIGPNGAGKSTTIRSVMHFIKHNQGHVFIDGKPFDLDDIDLKRQIGYLPSEIHLYEDYTVKQMLDYSASFYKDDLSVKTKMLVDKLEVPLNKKIEELSLGNLKKVGIVLAMMHSPSILILDEATSGLDPFMQEVFYQLLKDEQKQGTTIFFSSHILSEIKRICDRVGIIKDGHLIKIEDMKELRNSPILSVTIESPDLTKIIKDLNLEKDSFIKEEDQLHFISNHELNALLTILNKYKLKKLLIEEPSIEEIFMHYYK